MSPMFEPRHLIGPLAALCALTISACSGTGAASGAAPDPNAPASFGSLTNAVIATPRLDDDEPLVYFARSLSDEQRAELEASAPNLEVIVGLAPEAALARAEQAHGVDVAYATPEFMAAASNLAWVQVPFAGVDRFVGTEHIGANPSIVLTNLRAVHAPTIADHAFGLLLTLTRDLPVHLANRASGTWDRDGSGRLTPVALPGRTLFVVGLGGIGNEVAKRAKGFGMRVLASRRSAAEAPPWVDELGTADQLHEFLPRADVVVVCVPLTNETEGLFDTAAFDALKPGAFFVNVARGRIVDTDALVAALESGRLAGAGLDVTAPEPLPADHVLWSMPNVVITPHVAGRAELTEQRRGAMYVEQLRRFAAGEALFNVVDRDAGY